MLSRSPRHASITTASKYNHPATNPCANIPAGPQAMATMDRTSEPDSRLAESPPFSATCSTTVRLATTPSRTGKKPQRGSSNGATSAKWCGAIPPPLAAILTTAPLPVKPQRRTATRMGSHISRIRSVALILALLPSSPFATTTLKVRIHSRSWMGRL